MDSTKYDETLSDDAKIKSDLFNLAEKLHIELRKKNQELQVKDEELQKKDEELAKERQEKQVCNIFYCLHM
jgi:ribosomal protein S4